MSIFADKIIEKSRVRELGNLDIISASKIHAIFIEIGYKNYKLDVYYDESPKRIIAHVFDSNSNEFYVKPKIDINNIIMQITGLQDFVFEFAKRS